MEENLDLIERLAHALLEYHLGLAETIRPFPEAMARNAELIQDAEAVLAPRLKEGLVEDFIVGLGKH